ncbi:MAG: serine/threonine protein kinase [Myxococcota bacterium]|jgi:serine/threonine protein kinase
MLASQNQAAEVLRALPGGYALMREVGAGAYATVYEGTDPDGQSVAIKLLSSGHELAELRFNREIKVMKALPKNPYIVEYLADGQCEDGRPFIVMEFVKGFTLGTLLRSGRRLTESAACKLMMQLCDAFAELHKLGLSHGDIKPDNIMMSKDNDMVRGGAPGFAPSDVVHLAQVLRSGMTMKLLDFGQVRDTQGLLRLLEDESGLKGGEFSVDPDIGVVAGTPEYLSPEQVRDAMRAEGDIAETDTAADVFGLGVIFYELLSGDVPWPFHPSEEEGPRYQAEARAYLEERSRGADTPRSPSGASPALWSVIARSLHSDAKNRQGEARAMYMDIDRYDRYGVGVPGDLDNEATVMAFLPDLVPGSDESLASSTDTVLNGGGPAEDRRVDKRTGRPGWVTQAIWVAAAAVGYVLLAFDLI